MGYSQGGDTDSDLREIDLYSFQCLLKHEGKAKFGEASREWQINPANFSIDGNYPVRQLWERARYCWNKILFHDSRSVLVVARNAVNQALVATVIGLGTEYFRVLLQSNCGVSVLDFTPGLRTPGSPVAGGSSGGRKSSKRIILVCHGSSQRDSKSQKTAELLLDLRVKTVVSSPNMATTGTANTIVQISSSSRFLYQFKKLLTAWVLTVCRAEMKQTQNLDVDNILQQSKKDVVDVPYCSGLVKEIRGWSHDSVMGSVREGLEISVE